MVYFNILDKLFLSYEPNRVDVISILGFLNVYRKPQERAAYHGFINLLKKGIYGY